MRTYSELLLRPTFEERLLYLSTDSLPSELTFDQLRILNQRFYNSKAWKNIRKEVIARDLGFDLAFPGKDIIGKIIVHHINPLRPSDFYTDISIALDPEFLVCTSHMTHEAIHFGYEPIELLTERQPGDTRLW